jgi:hypothetical protein
MSITLNPFYLYLAPSKSDRTESNAFGFGSMGIRVCMSCIRSHGKNRVARSINDNIDLKL